MSRNRGFGCSPGAGESGSMNRNPGRIPLSASVVPARGNAFKTGPKCIRAYKQPGRLRTYKRSKDGIIPEKDRERSTELGVALQCQLRVVRARGPHVAEHSVERLGEKVVQRLEALQASITPTTSKRSASSPLGDCVLPTSLRALTAVLAQCTRICAAGAHTEHLTPRLAASRDRTATAF